MEWDQFFVHHDNIWQSLVYVSMFSIFYSGHSDGGTIMTCTEYYYIDKWHLYRVSTIQKVATLNFGLSGI